MSSKDFINVETIINNDITQLPQNIVFNQKNFIDKKLLATEMATYWELSVRFVKKNIYKYLGMSESLLSKIDELKENKQFDIAILRILDFLNPIMAGELKKIIEDDIAQEIDDTVATKGKLKYYGGDTINGSVYSHSSTYVENFPKESDKVQTGKGSILILGEKIGDGGEGIVYTTNRKNEVIKLIKRDNNGCIKDYVQHRIEQMVKVKITNPLVIWPTDVVYNEDGLFVGFTMKQIKGIDLKRFTSSIVKNVNDNPDEFNINLLDKKSVCKIAISILDTLSYLHDMNIIMGDIKLENFMIMDNNIENIYFIDCDSYQVGHFPSILVSPGFIPPEIDSINLGRQNNRFRTFGNENFCVFSLMFHLVFRARPPYSQQIHDDQYASEVYRVKKGMFPYFLDKEKTINHCPKGMEEPIWGHLPSYMKEAFISVGHIDGDHFLEENRLGPKEWKHLFKCYLEDLEGVRLQTADPICNQYHYGINEFINYENVEMPLPMEADVSHNLTLEEVITRKARNNNYMKNMILYKCIDSDDFPIKRFNNKLFTSRILFSLHLIKNWSLGLEFIKQDKLVSYSLTPSEYTKVNNNKISKNYSLALFEFVRIINPNIFLAYDGLIFNKLDEYSTYLNDNYNLEDRIIIPFDILESVIEDSNTKRALKNIFAKTTVDMHDLELMTNLFSESNIYYDGVCYPTLHNYVLSVFQEDLKVKDKNLFQYKTISNNIFQRNNIDPSIYNFTSLKGYYQLAMNVLRYIPFKSKDNVFTCLTDIVDYSKSDTNYEEKYTFIGKWVKSGLIKIYSSYYPQKQSLTEELDLYRVCQEKKLTNWEAGQLFYLSNVSNPLFCTLDNKEILNLKDLMEKLLKTEELDNFVHDLNKNTLFITWLELYKKADYKKTIKVSNVIELLQFLDDNVVENDRKLFVKLASHANKRHQKNLIMLLTKYKVERKKFIFATPNYINEAYVDRIRELILTSKNIIENKIDISKFNPNIFCVNKFVDISTVSKVEDIIFTLRSYTMFYPNLTVSQELVNSPLMILTPDTKKTLDMQLLARHAYDFCNNVVLIEDYNFNLDDNPTSPDRYKKNLIVEDDASKFNQENIKDAIIDYFKNSDDLYYICDDIQTSLTESLRQLMLDKKTKKINIKSLLIVSALPAINLLISFILLIMNSVSPVSKGNPLLACSIVVALVMFTYFIKLLNDENKITRTQFYIQNGKLTFETLKYLLLSTLVSHGVNLLFFNNGFIEFATNLISPLQLGGALLVVVASLAVLVGIGYCLYKLLNVKIEMLLLLFSILMLVFNLFVRTNFIGFGVFGTISVFTTALTVFILCYMVAVFKGKELLYGSYVTLFVLDYVCSFLFLNNVYLKYSLFNDEVLINHNVVFIVFIIIVSSLHTFGLYVYNKKANQPKFNY